MIRLPTGLTAVLLAVGLAGCVSRSGSPELSGCR
jgi:hypothetical protein